MTRGRTARIAGAVGLVAAGTVAGGVLASTLSANAATGTSGTSSATGGYGGGTRPDMPAHGSAAHEDAEKAVTGTNADKAKAAAVKSVGSGTAGDVTTDFTGQGYEVTVTKADGSKVEVHLDSSFNVAGPGGPGGHGGPGGAPGGPEGSGGTSAG